MRNLLFIALLLAAMPAAALAQPKQPKPTPESAKGVMDFYFNGQGQGVVLADARLCTDVVENECAGEVSSLKVDAPYKLWMAYVVPQDDEVDNIIIQFNQGGLTRLTRDVSVKGSIRYRTWRTFSLNRPGRWEAKILQDRGGNVEVLRTVNLTVTE